MNYFVGHSIYWPTLFALIIHTHFFLKRRGRMNWYRFISFKWHTLAVIELDQWGSITLCLPWDQYKINIFWQEKSWRYSHTVYFNETKLKNISSPCRLLKVFSWKKSVSNIFFRKSIDKSRERIIKHTTLVSVRCSWIMYHRIFRTTQRENKPLQNWHDLNKMAMDNFFALHLFKHDSDEKGNNFKEVDKIFFFSAIDK